MTQPDKLVPSPPRRDITLTQLTHHPAQSPIKQHKIRQLITQANLDAQQQHIQHPLDRLLPNYMRKAENYAFFHIAKSVPLLSVMAPQEKFDTVEMIIHSLTLNHLTDQHHESAPLPPAKDGTSRVWGISWSPAGKNSPQRDHSNEASPPPKVWLQLHMLESGHAFEVTGFTPEYFPAETELESVGRVALRASPYGDTLKLALMTRTGVIGTACLASAELQVDRHEMEEKALKMASIQLDPPNLLSQSHVSSEHPSFGSVRISAHRVTSSTVGRYASANMIQSRWRCFEERKHFRKAQIASRTIQAYIRSFLARVHIEERLMNEKTVSYRSSFNKSKKEVIASVLKQMDEIHARHLYVPLAVLAICDDVGANVSKRSYWRRGSLALNAESLELEYFPPSNKLNDLLNFMRKIQFGRRKVNINDKSQSSSDEESLFPLPLNSIQRVIRCPVASCQFRFHTHRRKGKTFVVQARSTAGLNAWNQLFSKAIIV